MIRTHTLILLAVLAFLASNPISRAADLLAQENNASKKVHLTEAANDPAFHKALLQAASEYKTYGQVDDNFQFAPALCAAPSMLPQKQPKISSSTDASTHGQKIYYLYAKNKLAYMRLRDPNTPQTIVKESWTPKKTISSGGVQQLSPDQINALFIMVKLEGTPSGTDNGWVYGTVTADGHTVTSSGKVQSCMGCHQDAPHGRLFGIKKESFP